MQCTSDRLQLSLRTLKADHTYIESDIVEALSFETAEIPYRASPDPEKMAQTVVFLVQTIRERYPILQQAAYSRVVTTLAIVNLFLINEDSSYPNQAVIACFGIEPSTLLPFSRAVSIFMECIDYAPLVKDLEAPLTGGVIEDCQLHDYLAWLWQQRCPKS